MSAILLPLVAAGGIYLAIDAFSKKTKKHRHHDSSDSSNRTEYSTKTDTTDSYTKTAPIKSRRRRRGMKERSPRNLFSLRLNGNKSKSKSKRKDNRKLEKTDRKLFVFYSFGEKNKDWDYKNLPSTWKMKRRVLSVNRTNHYNNVDVFTGEKNYQDKMREYLEKAFS